MHRIYFSIALLALLGDMLKRILPPTVALMAVYGLATAILFVLLANGKRHGGAVSPEGKILFFSVLLLVLLYLLQLLTSYSSPFFEGLSHAMYMCIPLLYILIFLKFCPWFDLVRLGRVILLLMIPINLVALVQYFIDPNFMISTAYSGELGGIIQRNFLEGGTFSRYPALFASADRYSAMGLMQLYFTLVVFKGSESLTRKGRYWLAINLISACVALFIAGARSRILIAVAAFVAMGLTLILGMFFSSKGGRIKRVIKRNFSLLAGGTFIIALVAAGWSMQKNDGEAIFPVITMLAQSVEQGDISHRVEEAASESQLHQGISLFGQGLGTVGHGKPGEFGIKSMWIESGIFWGALMVLAFTSIITALCLLAWRAFLAFEPVDVALYTIPILLLVFAVLAGLSSAFELSTGVLLGCAIGVIARSRKRIIGAPTILSYLPENIR